MSSSDKPWFNCCNGDDIRHDKWQDIDPRARNAAQRQIDMITGKNSSETKSSNSHTENFSIQNYIRPGSNFRQMNNNQPKTTKNVVDSVQESIIYGRFDDLMNSNTFVKSSTFAQQNTRLNGAVGLENHKVRQVPLSQFQPVYQSYTPSVQQQTYQQTYQQMPVNNIYARR